MGGFIHRPTRLNRVTARVNSLIEIDYAYLAGIIDGEGTISITKGVTHRRGRDYVAFAPTVTVSNTNLLLHKSLQTRFGGNLVSASRSSKHRKQAYILFFRRAEMLALLPKIIPYLTAKRTKAELLLEYMTSRKRHVIAGSDGKFIGIPLTDRQKEIIAEIRRYNRRGPPI